MSSFTKFRVDKLTSLLQEALYWEDYDCHFGDLTIGDVPFFYLDNRASSPIHYHTKQLNLNKDVST